MTNGRSHLTKVKDALNQEYTFTYDPLGRQLTQTRAGSTMSFEYDAVGNRTERTDYMGRVTEYEYDVLNRLKKINYVTGSPNSAMNLDATYTYDALSRLATAVNNVGTVAFTYDTRNRLKTTTDVFGHIVEYGYDANGNRTLLKLDGTDYATYAYDNADRLTGITNSSDSTTTTYAYDIADRLISRAFPNSVTTTYEFDGMSRLIRLKDASTSATLFDRQYSYNVANQVSQIAELTGTKIFGYDNLDRLTSVSDAVNGNESYTYDGIGRRTASHLSSTYSYQPFNKLTSSTSATYGYDTNGNTVQKSEGSNFWRYTWDFENRLTQAVTRRQTARYKYDALGRRVQRFIAGNKENTKFTYDGEDVLLDDDLGTLTKYIDGPGIDNKLRSQTGSDIRYFLSDHLGSTNALADANGGLTSQTQYDAFGNQTGSLTTRYGFTGRERDGFTTLLHNRARSYDSKLGRFLSEDPIGFSGGDVNLYAYVKNQPMLLRDPSGLIGFSSYPDGRLRIRGDLWEYYDFYNDLHRRRVAGHQRYPGEENSAMRHCVVSCESSSLWGSFDVRLMGIANETQGVDLDVQRWWNNRPTGAFQWSDLSNNEKGFSCEQTVRQGFSGSCVECCTVGCNGQRNPFPNQTISPTNYRYF